MIEGLYVRAGRGRRKLCIFWALATAASVLHNLTSQNWPLVSELFRVSWAPGNPITAATNGLQLAVLGLTLDYCGCLPLKQRGKQKTPNPKS